MIDLLHPSRRKMNSDGDGQAPAWLNLITVRRHPRARRLALRVNRAADGITLTIPPHCSDARARDFLKVHEDWIAARLNDLPKNAIAHGSMPFLGAETTIHRLPLEAAPKGRGVPEALYAPGVPALAVWGDDYAATAQLRKLCRNMARRLLPERLDLAARAMRQAGVEPPEYHFDLRDARSRWGSCSKRGRIMLNWRLIFAELDTIDYVVVHELCHLRHFDHSRAFWALVENFCPGGAMGRKKAESWLSRHASRMNALL